MKRGEIWWATLPSPRRSEPGYRRPVVIVQSNAFNESQLHTVVVAVITSNTRLGKAPGNVSLTKRQSGLSKLSVVNVSQIVTLDKSYLTERVRRLPKAQQSFVDRGLRLVLSV
jgi:mRNA interferase MazF